MVVVDAKSGTTGAGRSPAPGLHAVAVLENVSPYRVGEHQHAPEIASLLGFPVAFVPHLLPVRRGLIASCYVRPEGADLRAALEEQYAQSHVVSVLPEGVVPDLARVQGTDCAEIGVFQDRLTGGAFVVCALDNLGKGAAGQAVQNVNLLYGFEETLGLRLSGVLV
jgi:N-acetyl-gamma-glutamyl-phosphate reductase